MHPEARACASILDAEGASQLIDVVCTFEDGTWLTVTNAPAGLDTFENPWPAKLHRPGAGAEELHQAMLEQAAGRSLRPLTVDDFASLFQQFWEEDMRLRRGGLLSS